MVTLTYQERFRTLQGVFDEFTNRNLFELQSRGVFDDLISPIKVGKESNVFIAKSGKKKIIVKIYRVQNCDFKRMFHYIREDPRYEYLKHHRREIIFAWVQREYKNLLKAKEAGILCPAPLGWKAHILIEEMIGPPSLPMKDTIPKHPREFLTAIIQEMRKLYQAKLVHGDLSSFNILNHREKPYLIDFSQGTLTKTDSSSELLQRDIKNVLQFFSKLGVQEDAEKVFKEITDIGENHG